MRSSLRFSYLQPKAVERHFNDVKKRYGDVLAIDLINQVYNFVPGCQKSLLNRRIREIKVYFWFVTVTPTLVILLVNLIRGVCLWF